MRLPPDSIAVVFAVLLSTPVACAQEANTASQPSAKVTSPAHKSAPKSLPRKRSHKVAKHLALSDVTKKKVVVQHGGTTEALPQMAPLGPQHQDSAERRKSGELLTATEANVKSLEDKKLTTDQQATVRQIHQFMEQSRAALDAGDLKQGYNLASKANVLSEELRKH